MKYGVLTIPADSGVIRGNDIEFHQWVELRDDEDNRYRGRETLRFVAKNAVEVIDSMPVPEDLAEFVLRDFPGRNAKVTDWYLCFGDYSYDEVKLGGVEAYGRVEDPMFVAVTVPMYVEVMLLDDDDNQSIVDEGTVTNILVDAEFNMVFRVDTDGLDI